MEALMEFLDMGGYAGFVWPAYGLAALVLGGLALDSLRRLRTQQRDLHDLGPAAERGRTSATRSGSRAGS